MRVTKAIREYVEEEIYKKYDAVGKQIGSEYEEEKKQVITEVTKIMKEASKKAEEYITNAGFEYEYGYRRKGIFSLDANILKRGIEEANWEERNKFRSKAQQKIKQVLFDLEMGDTGKQQLREILDSIIVD